MRVEIKKFRQIEEQENREIVMSGGSDSESEMKMKMKIKVNLKTIVKIPVEKKV